MAEYDRKPQVFLKRGSNLVMPPDRLGREWFQIARNVRSFILGEWRQRFGTVQVLTLGASSPILWMARLNNNIAGSFRRFFGNQAGSIYVDSVGHNSASLADTGYSGEPYSSIEARPDRSPLPYLFVGNSGKKKKFATDGTASEWGLAAPTKAPTVEMGGVFINALDLCDSAAGFAATNGAASLQSRVSAVAISHILYDSGSTGYASVAPATIAEDFQEGMLITFSGPVETVAIEEVYQPIVSTTIAAISYDSGSTGACCIVLTTPTTGLERNSVVRINSAENVRVLSVTEGLDGIPSFRCVTVGTFSAGQTVVGLRTFRAFLNSTHTNAETLSTGYVQLAVAGAGLSTLRKTASLDASSAGGRPVQAEDFIHVSLLVSDFSLVTEIQVQFDVDSSTNDFTQNYFFKAVRQPDLQASYAQTAAFLTAQQQLIQRQQIDEFTQQRLEAERQSLLQNPFVTTPTAAPEIAIPLRNRLDEINRELGEGFNIDATGGGMSDEGTGGKNQWTELKIPISSFERVGSDETRGWANIAAFGISVIATGVVNVGLDSIWVGGTFGPDTQGAPGYTYVYRMRNSTTGSRSNPSPPTRSPILPKRDQVAVTIPSGYPDPQADVVDVYRIGGTLGEYHLVCTTIPAAQVIDTIDDSTASRQPILEVDRFKPWISFDIPKTGVCNVVGTTVTWVSGDQFNTQWVRGTIIVINSGTYTFYSNPTSVTRVEINESAGNLTNVTFKIQEPLLDSQPLPCVFGPYAGPSAEFNFAVGDTRNPGYLYWTNGNDVESTSDANFIELCPPGERLMNGCVLDGIVYTYSDRRVWRILPSFSGGDSGAGSDFYPQLTAIGKGLASRWGLCVGDAMYFVSFDGIYKTRGDAIESITDDSLAPLFRRDGSNLTDLFFAGMVAAISFASVDEKYLSLTYSYDGIYFTYRGVDGNFYVWYHGFLHGGWVLDSWTNVNAIPTRYLREILAPGVDNVYLGSRDGRFFQMSSDQLQDQDGVIPCMVRDREEIWDLLRGTFQLADLMVDVTTGGVQIDLTTIYNSGAMSESLDSIPPTNPNRAQYVRSINGGAGRAVRGVALQFEWGSNAGSPRLYAWEPAAIPKPETINNRATDFEDGGYNGNKWVQGFRLTADTQAQDVNIHVEYDGGIAAPAASFVINHAGENTQVYTFPPFVAHEMRIIGDDNEVEWRNMGIEWIYEPEPELATIWNTQYTSLDLPGYSHIREMLIPYRSHDNHLTGADMEHFVDGVSNGVYHLPPTGGQRQRAYVPLRARKGKYHKFVFTSSEGSPFGFSLYIKDVEVRAGSWGRTDNYQIIKPFGDLSRENGGARV